jgi:hypothetical protein
MSRILIFDRSGTAITELKADCPRSWALNEYGRAQFTLSTSDPKCILENIQFGNFIYVEHPKLTAWAGVIDTPREWGAFKVTVNAYSPEKILEWRIGQTGSQKVNEVTGTTITRILDIANQSGDTLISQGDIYLGGQSKQEQINLTSLRDELRRLLDDSGYEFTIDPVYTGGKLRFKANVLPKAGRVLDKSLTEGFNIEANDSPLTEQGVIANDVMGYTDSATWNSKTTYTANDADSQSKYGIRQSTISFLGQNQTAGLETGTKAELASKKNPRKTFNLAALDVGDTYSWMQLGNTVYLRMHSVGFYGSSKGVSTKVRIIGYGFDESEGKVSLVCDEVIE